MDVDKENEKNTVFSLGRKNPEKIKREIDIEIKPWHLYAFVIVLIITIISAFIYNPLESDQKQLFYVCEDGTKELYKPTKEYYCGIHVDELTYGNKLNLIEITNGTE